MEPQTELPTGSRRQLIAAGWSDQRLARAVRSDQMTRIIRGTYAGGRATEITPRMRLDALLRHVGDGGAAVLGSACLVHGLPLPWAQQRALHIRVRPGSERTQRAGVRFHAWLLADDELTVIDGTPVTTVARTVTDIMRTGDRLGAIAVADAALQRRLVGAVDLESARVRAAGQRGIARCRDWWSEIDGRAESPLETRVRLRAADGGYPPTELQKEFLVDGHTFRTDLAWHRGQDRWLIAEADGVQVHDAPSALHRDRWRSNLLVATGRIELVRFTWRDTVAPRRIPDVLGRVLCRP